MLFDDYIYILPTLFGNWGRLFNPVEEKYRCISNKNMKYHPISWGVVYFFNHCYQMRSIIREHLRKSGPLPLNPPFYFQVFSCFLEFGQGRGEGSLFHCHVLSIWCPGRLEKFPWGKRSQNVLGVETCYRMAKVLPFSCQERA